MLLIVMIRMNLIILVSLTLLIDSSLLDEHNEPKSEKEVEGVLIRAMNNKSQSRHQISPIVSHQSPSRNKKEWK